MPYMLSSPFVYNKKGFDTKHVIYSRLLLSILGYATLCIKTCKAVGNLMNHYRLSICILLKVVTEQDWRWK